MDPYSAARLSLEGVAAVVPCRLALGSLRQFAQHLDVAWPIEAVLLAVVVVVEVLHWGQPVVRGRVGIAACKHGEGHGSPALPHARASSKGDTHFVCFAFDLNSKVPGIAPADGARLVRALLLHGEVVLAAFGARGAARGYRPVAAGLCFLVEVVVHAGEDMLRVLEV